MFGNAFLNDQNKAIVNDLLWYSIISGASSYNKKWLSIHKYFSDNRDHNLLRLMRFFCLFLFRCIFIESAFIKKLPLIQFKSEIYFWLQAIIILKPGDFDHKSTHLFIHRMMFRYSVCYFFFVQFFHSIAMA